MNAIRAMLTGAIDYAGLFPPAALSMADAVKNYAAYRTSTNLWALGRFVVPVPRLKEYSAALLSTTGEDHEWPLTVLAGSDVHADRSALAEFGRGAVGRPVESIECKAASPAEIDRARDLLHTCREVYVEIPIEKDPSPLVDLLARHGLRAKVRTGGVTPELFPESGTLARFLHSCSKAGVAFKATAGLHHPLRARYRLTYEADSPNATMYGFINLIVAAALCGKGVNEKETGKILEEEDASAFRFSEGEIAWGEHLITTEELELARAQFVISFGSCSFTEPLEDLHTLSLL